MRSTYQKTCSLAFIAERTHHVYQAAGFLLGLHLIFCILFSSGYCCYFFTMSSSVKYDIPQLDRDTRFALWQVKMRAILTQSDVDDALDKFGNKDSKSWNDDEKKKRS